MPQVHPQLGFIHSGSQRSGRYHRAQHTIKVNHTLLVQNTIGCTVNGNRASCFGCWQLQTKIDFSCLTRSPGFCSLLGRILNCYVQHTARVLSMFKLIRVSAKAASPCTRLPPVLTLPIARTYMFVELLKSFDSTDSFQSSSDQSPDFMHRRSVPLCWHALHCGLVAIQDMCSSVSSVAKSFIQPRHVTQ
jgi:hypothetical protein